MEVTHVALDLSAELCVLDALDILLQGEEWGFAFKSCAKNDLDFVSQLLHVGERVGEKYDKEQD